MNKASYWSQDVYKMLDIGASTLRRWCLELEKKGWEFDKDENGRRRYHERDVSALRYIKDMSERQEMTVTDAINTVISKHNISSQDEPNMLMERSNLSDQLALSIQKDVHEIKEALGKAFLDLKEENAELREEIRQMRQEIAAGKDEPKKPWWKLF